MPGTRPTPTIRSPKRSSWPSRTRSSKLLAERANRICPNCGEIYDGEPYDIGDGPEFACRVCEWCWGALGQSLTHKPIERLHEIGLAFLASQEGTERTRRDSDWVLDGDGWRYQGLLAHEYVRGEVQHPMHTDPLCRDCGEAKGFPVHRDPLED